MNDDVDKNLWLVISKEKIENRKEKQFDFIKFV